MNEGRISTRYARALLLSLEKRPEEAQAVYEQALALLPVLRSIRRKVKSVLESAIVKEADKRRFFTSLIARFAPKLEHFASLMAEKGRAAFFERALYMYLVLYRRAHGIVATTVTTVAPLTEQQRHQIEAFLARSYGHNLELQCELDTELIGGFQLEVEGKRFDRSVRGELARIAASFE